MRIIRCGEWDLWAWTQGLLGLFEFRVCFHKVSAQALQRTQPCVAPCRRGAGGSLGWVKAQKTLNTAHLAGSVDAGPAPEPGRTRPPPTRRLRAAARLRGGGGASPLLRAPVSQDTARAGVGLCR